MLVAIDTLMELSAKGMLATFKTDLQRTPPTWCCRFLIEADCLFLPTLL